MKMQMGVLVAELDSKGGPVKCCVLVWGTAS
jgi:hypothetical protein